MATDHVVHHEGDSTNTALIVLLVVAILIVGFLLLRGGIGGATRPATDTGANINVELPTGGQGGGGQGQ